VARVDKRNPWDGLTCCFASHQRRVVVCKRHDASDRRALRSQVMKNRTAVVCSVVGRRFSRRSSGSERRDPVNRQ
jgi:hypothetical protein